MGRDHQSGVSLQFFGAKDYHGQKDIRFRADLPTLPSKGTKILTVKLDRIGLESLQILTDPVDPEDLFQIAPEVFLPFAETTLPSSPGILTVRPGVQGVKMVFSFGIVVLGAGRKRNKAQRNTQKRQESIHDVKGYLVQTYEKVYVYL